MGDTTNIAWTDATWNPWIGCSHVSLGCDNCYMFTGMRKYGRNPEIVQRTAKSTFNAPLRWKESRNIFTCSWSDFFHKAADEWREQAWNIMLHTPHHIYQILTKRPGLAVAWSKTHEWPDYIWIGTSVESQKYAPRLDVLARVPAKVRFVSAEPLLGPLDLKPWLFGSDERTGTADDGGILNWVITGGESGPSRRPADSNWFRDIRNQCTAAGVPYFHKQGNHLYPGKDRVLDGRTWNELPGETTQ